MPPRVVSTGRHVRLEPLTVAAVPGLVAAASEGRDSYGYTRVPADVATMGEYVAEALGLALAGDASQAA